jgi:hypothetical protein
MRRVGELLWYWIKAALYVVLAAVTLHLLAAFTISQSVVLACFVVLVIAELGSLSDRVLPTVVTMTVDPAWEKLLVEFGVTDQEGIGRLAEAEARDPASYQACRPIRLTFLNARCVYVHGYDLFQTRVDLRARFDLPEPRPAHERKPLYGAPFLGVYLKRSIDGYQFGISTPASRDKSLPGGLDDDHIPIATIPYSELHLHQAGDLLYSDADRLIRKAAEDLKRLGWKDEERTGWSPDKTARIEHEYVKVRFLSS